MANFGSPLRSSALVSKAKEEKVVNPPKSPVKRNALAEVEK